MPIPPNSSATSPRAKNSSLDSAKTRIRGPSSTSIEGAGSTPMASVSGFASASERPSSTPIST